jgi:nitric oxide reductase NorQ protein
MITKHKTVEQDIEKYTLAREPYYLAVADEVELFEAAYRAKLPVMLKGPTGCGKTRFIEYMAWRLSRPLVTVACHEDLSSTDLVGRFLLEGDETVWHDGPLTTAVKAGAICYLDEVVEARKDTIVLIHPLTDDRRILPVEKRGTILRATDDFLLVVSYNPGYQSVLKDLKQSTRQRFVSLEFDYPPPQLEADILMHEGGVDEQTARDLVIDRREGAQPERPRPGRRRFDAPAGLRGTTGIERHRAAHRLRSRHHQPHHR